VTAAARVTAIGSGCGGGREGDGLPAAAATERAFFSAVRFYLWPAGCLSFDWWVLCAARYVFLQRTLKTKGGQGGGPRRAVRPPFDT
jgi:hypothetical protein